MSHRLNPHTKQNGFVLLFVMITLFTLSFLVLYAFERAILQAKMASNMQHHIVLQYQKNARMATVLQPRQENQNPNANPNFDSYKEIDDNENANADNNALINHCLSEQDKEKEDLKSSRQDVNQIARIHNTTPSVHHEKFFSKPEIEALKDERAMTQQQQAHENNLSQATRSELRPQMSQFKSPNNLQKFEKGQSRQTLEQNGRLGPMATEEEDEA